MIKYIFSINTGRCGSAYVTDLFNYIEGVSSLHEPEPIMNGAMMRKFLRGNLSPMKRAMPEKIKSIHQKKGAAEIYVETNHSFIKGFGWFISEYLPAEEIGVIILKRDIEQIVTSTMRVSSSPLDRIGRNWIITPPVNYHLVPFPYTYPLLRYYYFLTLRKTIFRPRMIRWFSGDRKKNIVFIENYERKTTEWYVQETWARAEAFKKQFPQMKFYEVTVAELNSFDGVKKMMDAFEIQRAKISDAILSDLGLPVNQRLNA